MKVKTLIASIFSIFVNLVIICYSGWTAFILLLFGSIASGLQETSFSVSLATVMLVMVLAILLSIASLILACVLFGGTKSDEALWKKKKVAIATIVLNFVLLILFGVIIIFTYKELLYLVFGVICFAVLLIINLLYLIDFLQTKKKMRLQKISSDQTKNEQVENNQTKNEQIQ